MSGDAAREHERRMRKAAEYLAARRRAEGAHEEEEAGADSPADSDVTPSALAGKPLPGLGRPLDPDWWVKELIRREQLTGLAPAPFLLRKEDAELDRVLDGQYSERRVREILEDFNARVIEARRQLLGGPPVVTPTRDVEREVKRWKQRRAPQSPADTGEPPAHRSWWRRILRGSNG